MKICITRSEKYVYSETFIRNQIKGLSEHADVYTIHTGRYPERKEDGSLLSPKPFWLIHKVVKLLVGRNNFFSNFGVKKYLKNNKVDLVWANYGMAGAHMVSPSKDLNIPLITIFHGHDATDKKFLKEYQKKYLKLFKYASFIIAVSEEMKKRLLNIGANPDTIRVIPYGIDITKFKPQTKVVEEKSFLAVGRFTAKKGPLYTIRAFHQVLQKHPEATLTMVGKKSGLYTECNNLVTELGIENSVNFTGILNQDEVSELMQSSFAYVQHSIIAPNGDMEGTPLSILEAGASGIPIVSTRHAGIKEAVVHKSTGFLVDEKDIDNMAKYMIELCDNPEKAKEYGLNGRKHVEQNYYEKEQVKKYYELIKEAVAKK